VELQRHFQTAKKKTISDRRWQLLQGRRTVIHSSKVSTTQSFKPSQTNDHFWNTKPHACLIDDNVELIDQIKTELDRILEECCTWERQKRVTDS
jgi:hypothetical protein